MRRTLETLVALVASGLVGCKDQGTSALTNPFLTPDRVPPPSTRVLAPGAAAPYYPGDPLPGASPGTAPVGAAPTFAPGATMPTTPPGGWGSYPPQSSTMPAAAPGGDSIGVPRDEQGLRFAEGSNGAAVGNDAARLMGVARPSAAPTSAVTQRADRCAVADSAIAPFGGRLLCAANVPLARSDAGRVPRGSRSAAGASLASAELSRDGFRPQGSQPSTPSEPDNSFRPPEIRRDAAATTRVESGAYGMGAKQEWLRGQLEYWPATGQWSLRYTPAATPAGADGRVMIANPQVLANLSPGEMVVVEGQLFAQPHESGVVQRRIAWRPFGGSNRDLFGGQFCQFVRCPSKMTDIVSIRCHGPRTT